MLLACERAEPDDLARLEELVGRMAKADDFEDYRRADIRFHISVAEAARSPHLVTEMTDVQGRMSELIALIAHPEQVLTHSNAQHRRLVRLLARAGGGERGRADARAHRGDRAHPRRAAAGAAGLTDNWRGWTRSPTSLAPSRRSTSSARRSSRGLAAAAEVEYFPQGQRDLRAGRRAGAPRCGWCEPGRWSWWTAARCSTGSRRESCSVIPRCCPGCRPGSSARRRGLPLLPAAGGSAGAAARRPGRASLPGPQPARPRPRRDDGAVAVADPADQPAARADPRASPWSANRTTRCAT